MSPLIRNARLLERHKDDIDRHTQHDANSSAISQGGPESNIGQRQVLVKSEYEPRTGVYQTNQLDIVSGIKRITTRHRQQSSDADHEQAADGFRDYITHSLTAIITRSSGPFDRIDYLIAGLFYLNVFMSILNTVLLSFLVKSVQLSGHNLLSNHGGGIGGGAGLGLFTWDEHSESMHLDLPARLRSDKFLSVGTIESNQDKPLIIENVNTPTGHGDGANGFVNDGASPESSAWPSSLDKSMEGGQILISAKPRPLSTDSGLLSAATETANYILIPSARPSSTPLPPPQQPGGSFNGRAEQEKQQEQQQQQQQKLLHRQPVEMVTSSLILSQLNDEERHVTSKDSRNGAGGSSQMSYAVHHHVPLASGTRSDQLKRQTMGGVMHASSNSRSRRVLELDGKRQTIVLPLLNKIDLFPSGSSSLFVNNELKCNSGISGRLDDNFDIQTRWGNLSFQSGRTLRIVSRSDKLNLASTRLLTLDAPTLRFSVPQTNKMLISNGIEFLEMDQQRQQPKQLRLLEEKRGDRRVDDGEQLSGHLPISTVASASLPLPLEAFKLVLIDDILMAAQD